MLNCQTLQRLETLVMKPGEYYYILTVMVKVHFNSASITKSGTVIIDSNPTRQQVVEQIIKDTLEEIQSDYDLIRDTMSPIVQFFTIEPN